MNLLLLSWYFVVAFASIANDCHERVDGHYLVQFKGNLAPGYKSASDLQGWSLKAVGGGNVTHAWSFHTFRAFAAYYNEQELARLHALPEIDLVEYDCIARIPEHETPELLTGVVEEGFAGPVPDLPGYGQYRSDQNTLGYSMAIPFQPPFHGAGVTVWVLDTGVRLDHQEFQGRAIFGANFIAGESGDDGNGHGTHCAGTVGGINAGYATQATIGSVKVLANSGSGSWSGIVDGIQWVVDYKKANPGNHLISMSIGGGFTATANAAVNAAAGSGVFSIIAAGNSNADTKNYSPASAADAIAVAAIDSNNALASFSNWGVIVEIGAPGVSIKSAWWTSPTTYNTISGTSMACPAIAGQVAQLISEIGPVATVDALRNYMVTYGTKNAITPYTSPRILKNNLLGYDRWMSS
jgi:hypothetical protein